MQISRLLKDVCIQEENKEFYVKEISHEKEKIKGFGRIRSWHGMYGVFPWLWKNPAGKALRDVRGSAVLATKLFLDRSEIGRGRSVYSAVRKHLEGSMERLQTDMVDLYYLHKTGGVSVEEVAEAMGQLIKDGLIRGWGLSQVDVDVISRAHRVTPLTAIQNIYSMVERDSESRVIPYCLENNIGMVPFSPIASGLLSGKITTETKFERNDDVRNWVPQLSKANIAGNQPIIDLLKEYADRKNATSAQISLAWMLHKYPNVVPIPGSKIRSASLRIWMPPKWS